MNRQPPSSFDSRPVSSGTGRLPVFSSIEEIRLLPPIAFDGLGQHLLVDLYDCSLIPTTAEDLQQRMIATAERIRATVVTSSFHEFNPQGLSGVVVIAESHLAVHTWPEHGSVCVDLFTCAKGMDALAGLEYLFESFGAGTMTLNNVCRGGVSNNPQSRGLNE